MRTAFFVCGRAEDARLLYFLVLAHNGVISVS
jgi:hypothetical protein